MYHFLWQRVRIFVLVSITSFLLLAVVPITDNGQSMSLTFAAVRTGIAVRVDMNGTYTITTSNPYWTFRGNVGHPLSHLSAASGVDTLGSYREIDFTYQGQAARSNSIRTYAARTIVLFKTTYLTASRNSESFPTFTTYPEHLNHLSYAGPFGTYSFRLKGLGSPWLFFDTYAHSFLLSPAANFMVANLTMNSDGAIASTINQGINKLPQNFSHQTILVPGRGINNVYDTWGQAMTDLQQKVRPVNDVNITLNKLGYWTDNGASYYYTYIPRRGYTGTLEAVRRDFIHQGITLGYFQLDSWWYPKGMPPGWRRIKAGIYTYTADTTLFHRGLRAFQQQLGLPLLTHARWLDPYSPYHMFYTTSGNVSTDPHYWKTIMDFLHQSGVVTYEQDWLSAQAQTHNNLTDPEAFLNNMASAASMDGITLQYCMPDPRHYLQSTLYNNVLTIRVSSDRFVRARWDAFLYDSRLASALGLWPWSDVFMSTETNNLLLSTLSAGIVGIGDPLGKESRKNLLQTIRPDGVIVKPDTSIVPTDETYVAEAQGKKPAMVAVAYTNHQGLLAAYVFAYKRGHTPIQVATFTPSRSGFAGKVYIYNYFTRSGNVVDAGQSFSDQVRSGSYYVVVPIGPSGIAFLGDAGKFVSLGKKRISSLSDNGTVQATVSFAPGEGAITLHGYAPTRPYIHASSGAVNSVSYNPRTHLFSFSVSAGPNGSSTISMSTFA